MIELFNIDLLSYTVQTAETAPTHSYTIYWLILLGSMLLSWLVSARMKSRFSEYSQISIPVTGRQVAEQMLKDNHITDVKVISTPGHLTDHYNPADKTVNLSESVYNSNSIAAAAVAAHEVGHAVQHAQAYHWLGLAVRAGSHRPALLQPGGHCADDRHCAAGHGRLSVGAGAGHRPVCRDHSLRVHHASRGI